MKKVRRPQKVKSLKHAINERFLNHKKTTYTSTYFFIKLLLFYIQKRYQKIFFDSVSI